MKLCIHDCTAACDYCINFDDTNVIEEGEGSCRLTDKPKDPSWRCDDFVCINYKEDNK